MARRRVIRIEQPPESDQPYRAVRRVSGFWLEQMRYMGLISFPSNKNPEDEDGVFFIWPPTGVSPKPWQTMNIQRMRSFGINATAEMR